LQEAQDIFGVDFDYDEFDKYGDGYEEDEDEEDEYIDEEGLEDMERRYVNSNSICKFLLLKN
jgi:transcription elongation factor SPT6